MQLEELKKQYVEMELEIKRLRDEAYVLAKKQKLVEHDIIQNLPHRVGDLVEVQYKKWDGSEYVVNAYIASMQCGYSNAEVKMLYRFNKIKKDGTMSQFEHHIWTNEYTIKELK